MRASFLSEEFARWHEFQNHKIKARNPWNKKTPEIWGTTFRFTGNSSGCALCVCHWDLLQVKIAFDNQGITVAEVFSARLFLWRGKEISRTHLEFLCPGPKKKGFFLEYKRGVFCQWCVPQTTQRQQSSSGEEASSEKKIHLFQWIKLLFLCAIQMLCDWKWAAAKINFVLQVLFGEGQRG